MSHEPIWRRYRDFLRRRPDADVDEEVRFHLQMREREALAAGLDPDAAAAAARERFGNVDGVVAEVRAIDAARERRKDRAEWLGDAAQDARFALRSLRRAPAFAATAIVTIAVAIAANTTIFSFVDALLLEPLPFRHPGELVVIGGNIIASAGEMLALRQRVTVLSDLAMYRPCNLTLNDDRGAARLGGFCVTPNLFTMLGVAPELGRLMATNASDPGTDEVILLSHSFWIQRYGGDPGIVGRRITVDGKRSLVAGVMPERFHFPSTEAQFWAPLVIDRVNVGRTWGVGGNRLVGRLKPGIRADRAEAEITSVAIGMRHLNPLWDPGDDYGKHIILRPLQESLAGTERPVLLLLSACVVVVLLVACANLANLMLARVSAREREFTVRAALGGGRGRLVRQLLTESVLIAAIGASIGLALAVVGVRWAVASLPPGIPRVAEIRTSFTVLSFTAGLAVVTGIAFGLLPALRAAALGSSRGTTLTRDFGGGAAQHRLSSALVAGEVALAVLLAVTAGLLVRSFARLRDLSPGFQTEHVVAARLSPAGATYDDPARASAFYEQVLEGASALPGVSSAGAVDRPPLASAVYGMALRVEGQFEDVKHGLPTADHLQHVTPGYFSVLGIPILHGRAIDAGDRDGAPPVALVSQSLARRFWPNGDALGKHIGYPYESPWITIVGIVPDVRIDSLRDTSAMAVYIPLRQRGRFADKEMTILVRTTGDVASIGRGLRNVVSAIDHTVPVSGVRAMDDVIAQSVAKPRFTTFVVGGFSLAALMLGALGIYGVMSYVVSQRTHEMGVRIALGASSADIFGLVLGRGLALALIGAAVGCVIALVATHGLRSLLYGVSPNDPVTFATAALLFVVVAIVASYGPARRATRADPVQALRGN